mmetsp:Transcript_7040/g.15237  ORF Transcript_7040/g.15237 Transcript_7040/m.15237 type:complete len:142 (-) Transcript_7040:2916-3341(-)
MPAASLSQASLLLPVQRLKNDHSPRSLRNATYRKCPPSFFRRAKARRISCNSQMCLSSPGNGHTKKKKSSEMLEILIKPCCKRDCFPYLSELKTKTKKSNVCKQKFKVAQLTSYDNYDSRAKHQIKIVTDYQMHQVLYEHL